jgi:AraC-like DNA-binding protein
VQRQAVTHVHDLIALALGATREAADAARSRGVRAARLRAIKADIAAHLSSDDLAVAAVAARHRLPVRYVQRLFESEGVTFTDFVLDQRLACAHRLLADPRLAGLKIGMVAAEAGFSDLSYFNRTFRRRYGVTPSGVRAQAAR